jgi:hypothetical protein
MSPIVTPRPSPPSTGTARIAVTPADVTPTGAALADVTPARGGGRVLPARYVADYVELAYASKATPSPPPTR